MDYPLIQVPNVQIRTKTTRENILPLRNANPTYTTLMQMQQHDIKPGLQGRLQTTLVTQPLFLTVNPNDRKDTNYKSIN
jgi:hypothetical protein